MIKTRLRQIKHLLYRLKRDLGIPASFYKFEVVSVNYQTGVSTTTRSKTAISRVVLLPEKIRTRFEYDLTFLAANKNFAYGGFFQTRDRQVIIDASDLAVEVEMDEYLVFQNRRYNVVQITPLDYDAGWYLVVRETQEQDPNQLTETQVRIAQTIVGTVT
jgi:hypothetical protein